MQPNYEHFLAKHRNLAPSRRLLNLVWLTCLSLSSLLQAETTESPLPITEASDQSQNPLTYDVMLGPPTAHSDTQEPYKIALITAALEATRETHGDYTLFQRPGYMQTARAFLELDRGTQINTYYSITSRAREESAIPIRIPVRFGLLNYRLLLINKDKRSLFNNIQSAEDLRLLSAGIKNDWVLKEIFTRNGLGRVEVKTLDSLYQMLNQGRFDYLVRGVNEAFDELTIRDGNVDKVEILPNIVLYINSPLYLFVSNTHPHLAERLEHGFNLLLKSGKMQSIFWAEYSDDIELAGLEGRRVIEISNPFLPPRTPVERTELWYDPNSKFPINP